MTSMPISCLGWTISQWRSAYLTKDLSPETAISDLVHWLHTNQAHCHHAWIYVISLQELREQCDALVQRLTEVDGDLTQLPLFGVPCAVKDNIDVVGLPTTGGCPEYRFIADNDATAVERLKAAGAIIIGKTNLDQFATGLVGTRSPYGAVENSFDADYVSGGSSSGSSVVVAKGYVPFSFGTDTAGSGRVPAGFNQLYGVKSSLGAISTHGVIPACKSLDVVSIFALTAADAELVRQVCTAQDDQDCYSRQSPVVAQQPIRKLAYPANAPWFGDVQQAQAFDEALKQAKALGYSLTAIDFSPLFELAALLYQGPWVAERYAAVGEFMQQGFPGINAVVKGIIDQAEKFTAVDAFNGEYQRKAAVKKVAALFEEYDALFVPTTPCFPTIAQVNANPVEENSRLGTYTNFVNLSSLSALSIPARPRADGLPFGITVIGADWQDAALHQFAQTWESALQLPIAPVANGSAVSKESVVLAVVGAHLRDMPLNFQLKTRQAVFLEQTTTSSDYQLFALANTTPPKPGLVYQPTSESAQQIIVELWRLTPKAFGEFVAEVPRPLGIGNVTLEDGRVVKGFICEPEALSTAMDITHFGGWRKYLAAVKAGEPIEKPATPARTAEESCDV